MTPPKLVQMANQIARFFESQPGASAAAATAEHLKSFWDPSMRTALQRHARGGGAGLSPTAAAAVELLPPLAASAAKLG